eukprot:2488426-Pleurochrysis_carterae.AAC.1
MSKSSYKPFHRTYNCQADLSRLAARSRQAVSPRLAVQSHARQAGQTRKCSPKPAAWPSDVPLAAFGTVCLVEEHHSSGCHCAQGSPVRQRDAI